MIKRGRPKGATAYSETAVCIKCQIYRPKRRGYCDKCRPRNRHSTAAAATATATTASSSASNCTSSASSSSSSSSAVSKQLLQEYFYAAAKTNERDSSLYALNNNASKSENQDKSMKRSRADKKKKQNNNNHNKNSHQQCHDAAVNSCNGVGKADESGPKQSKRPRLYESSSSPPQDMSPFSGASLGHLPDPQLDNNSVPSSSPSRVPFLLPRTVSPTTMMMMMLIPNGINTAASLSSSSSSSSNSSSPSPSPPPTGHHYHQQQQQLNSLEALTAAALLHVSQYQLSGSPGHQDHHPMMMMQPFQPSSVHDVPQHKPSSYFSMALNCQSNTHSAASTAMRLAQPSSSSPYSLCPDSRASPVSRHTLPYPFSPSFSVGQPEVDNFRFIGRAERSHDEDCGDDSTDGRQSMSRARSQGRRAVGVGRSDEDDEDADDEDEEEAGKQLPGICSLALPRPQLPQSLPLLPRLAPPPYL